MKYRYICKYLCIKQLKTMNKGLFCYVKLTNQLSVETEFQKVAQHTGGLWLIHGTKHHKNNQLPIL